MPIFTSTSATARLSPREPHRSTTAQTHTNDPVAKAAQEIDVRRYPLSGAVQIDDSLSRAGPFALIPPPVLVLMLVRRAEQHRVRLARQRGVPQEERGRRGEQGAQEGRERRRLAARAAEEHHLVDASSSTLITTIGEEGAHARA
jgi:hypothetical protein